MGVDVTNGSNVKPMTSGTKKHRLQKRRYVLLIWPMMFITTAVLVFLLPTDMNVSPSSSSTSSTSSSDDYLLSFISNKWVKFRKRAENATQVVSSVVENDDDDDDDDDDVLTSNRNNKISQRKLAGKFIHITDMHPDPHHIEGGSFDSACHRIDHSKGSKKKENNEDEGATKYGTAMAGCDASFALVEGTLEWISREFSLSDIDFIVWTGDNVRHDNDRNIPRTQEEILQVNEQVSDLVSRFYSPTFQGEIVPIIPSVGNNDVYPHNVLDLGPGQYIRSFYKTWSAFISQDQHISFDRFMSFFQEVVPGKLAVVSLNTMFFYKSNPMVDNCNDKDQPGYQLLIWFGYLMEEFRDRGMKVWLTGHVPPLEKNYENSCYMKFNLWCWEYRDIIVGGLYGHMNLDHFVPIAGKQLREELKNIYSVKSPSTLSEGDFDDKDDNERLGFQVEQMDSDDYDIQDEFTVMGAKPVNKMKYINQLVKQYKGVSKKLKKRDIDSYSVEENDAAFKELISEYFVVNVAASVLPTFNPGFRVWEYNVTGLYDDVNVHAQQSFRPWEQVFKEIDDEVMRVLDEEGSVDQDTTTTTITTNNNGLFSKFKNKVVDVLGKKKKKKKNKKKGKNKKDKSVPRKMPDENPLGPAYTPQLFSPVSYKQYYLDLEKLNKKFKKHPETTTLEYELEYTFEDTGMESLLVGGYLKYCKKLVKSKKAWKKYLNRVFASTGYEFTEDA